MNNKPLAIGIIFLFVFSSVGSIGLEIKDADIPPVEPVNSPTNHAWPQQGYNSQHLGRSPYSTADNPGIEKWRFATDNWCGGSPSIGTDGIIYFGENDFYLYAVYPNGTLKWKFYANGVIGDYGSTPAIANDGTIYICVKYGGFIQAINPDGTEKWTHSAPDIDTSVTIGEDGMIYYGHHGGLDARFPNGTLKWRFNTDDYVQSTPAIDDNNIIYFGSHDDHIYAVYPNGTMKWKYQTDGWVHGSPTIGIDGTIYCGSDDDHLYAFYPNGTLQWKTKIVGSMRSSPSQDKDGNLYFGTSSGIVISVSPEGVIRWQFNTGDHNGIWGSTAAISDDGTIYIGNIIDFDYNGEGEIIALDLDGSLKWRKIISDLNTQSSVVISENGDVYICSSHSGKDAIWGNLHAFGSVDSNEPPDTPILEAVEEGHVRRQFVLDITGFDPDNNPLSYDIRWGDGNNNGWTDDYASGQKINEYHVYLIGGTYAIKVKAIDTFGLESDWAYLEVTMPVNQQSFSFPLLQRIIDRFPNAFPILRQLLGL